MKYIATILILFVCFSGYGQKDSLVLVDSSDWVWGKTKSEYDTVKVIMLVCDTSLNYNTTVNDHLYIEDAKLKTYKTIDTINIFHSLLLSWQYGYEVKETDAIEDIYFLNADKQPLKKSIIVWQTLIIK